MPKIRLLLADGNADFASACKSVFEDEGITVIMGASDGGQIPAQIKASQPDVVLMDSFLRGPTRWRSWSASRRMYPHICRSLWSCLPAVTTSSRPRR